ncbi:MAG: hypothetical protein JRE70_03520 [Deltaproteobacteria bacterium]|nr:hypothetical protein [Deltaproteobacteria bacterium]
MSGDFTLNSGGFPGDYYNRGALLLEDQGDLSLTMLGESWDDNYADLMVIIGTYDTAYAYLAGNGVPQNALSTIDASILIDQPDQIVDIDVPQVEVNVTFTYEGAPFVFSIYESADFYLQPDGTDDLIHLGPSYGPFVDVMVKPGVYDVIYARKWGTTYAQNDQAVVMEDVDIDNANSRFNINVEVCTVAPDWQLIIDGGDPEDFPVSIYTSAEFFLRNDRGDLVRLGASYEDSVMVDVVIGTYDLVYSVLNGNGTSVPRNVDTVVAEGLSIARGRCPLDIDVYARSVTPDLTLNGSPFAASIYQSGDIFLKDTTTGGLTSIGPTYNPPNTTLIIEGTYDTVYRRKNGTEVPVNTEADLPGQVTIDGINQTASVDVPAVTVKGDFSLNGGSFPSSVYHTANINLRQDDKEPVLLGETDDETESILIVGGVYDVIYEFVQGESLPRNAHFIVLDDELLDSDGDIDVDLLSRDIEVTFTLNGGPFPASAYQRGDFFLRGNHPDDLVYLGPSNAAPESARVIRADYEAIYQFVQSPTTVPVNSEAIVGQIIVD